MPEALQVAAVFGVLVLVVLAVGALLILAGGAALRGEDQELTPAELADLRRKLDAQAERARQKRGGGHV